MAVPLLLFRADLRRFIKSTGTLLLAFLLGSAVNYVAISEALCVSPSVLAAGLAADNVICAFAYLAPSGEAMALILMQVFFAVIGANGSIWNVIITTPSIFIFSLVQIVVHLAVILGFGKFFRFYFWHQMQMLVALQRHVEWPQQKGGVLYMVVPGILAGIFGIAIAIFLGIVFGVKVLKYM
ncbi:uncharacterized protein LOC115985643 [Quercus lobata]|uniref:uncharacterized protein LOC115985643 n=1 Tax=Quercus lobata TaxID=97700 RepID=UPI0012488435|nr:uncharacterized protein LOC115985643 [Quercus lobata]